MVLLAVVTAHEVGHEHAFAHSSQHISRHDGHPEIVHIHGGHGDLGGHGHGHGIGHVDYHVSKVLLDFIAVFC